jgi:hypothetical protein
MGKQGKESNIYIRRESVNKEGAKKYFDYLTYHFFK